MLLKAPELMQNSIPYKRKKIISFNMNQFYVDVTYSSKFSWALVLACTQYHLCHRQEMLGLAFFCQWKNIKQLKLNCN